MCNPPQHRQYAQLSPCAFAPPTRLLLVPLPHPPCPQTRRPLLLAREPLHFLAARSRQRSPGLLHRIPLDRFERLLQRCGVECRVKTNRVSVRPLSQWTRGARERVEATAATGPRGPQAPATRAGRYGIWSVVVSSLVQFLVVWHTRA